MQIRFSLTHPIPPRAKSLLAMSVSYGNLADFAKATPNYATVENMVISFCLILITSTAVSYRQGLMVSSS